MMMTYHAEPRTDRAVVVSHERVPASSRWIETVADYVRPRGIGLRRATSRTDTLACIELGGTALVILSHRVPALDALSILRSIRSVDIEVPCLLLADEAPQRMLAQALELRAYSVVKQPVAADLLTGLLDRILASE